MILRILIGLALLPFALAGLWALAWIAYVAFTL